MGIVVSDSVLAQLPDSLKPLIQLASNIASQESEIWIDRTLCRVQIDGLNESTIYCPDSSVWYKKFPEFWTYQKYDPDQSMFPTPSPVSTADEGMDPLDLAAGLAIIENSVPVEEGWSGRDSVINGFFCREYRWKRVSENKPLEYEVWVADGIEADELLVHSRAMQLWEEDEIIPVLKHGLPVLIIMRMVNTGLVGREEILEVVDAPPPADAYIIPAGYELLGGK